MHDTQASVKPNFKHQMATIQHYGLLMIKDADCNSQKIILGHNY